MTVLLIITFSGAAIPAGLTIDYHQLPEAHSNMTERRSGIRLALVIPVFNDWEPVSLLLHRIDELYRPDIVEIHALIVDDGSTDPSPCLRVGGSENSCVRKLDVLRAATNLGHQRAIAIGLVAVAGWNIDAVLVMDSDGEDRPEDIEALVASARANPDAIILAERAKRSEAATFKAGYFLYKLLFRLLTGQHVTSGNFSIIPAAVLKRLIFVPTLWNNLPATLIRSRSKLISVPTARGRRYAGQPKMDLVSLVMHGLSAISVYVDVIFVRLLLASAALIVLALGAIVGVTAYKVFTNLPTPGWATTVVSSFLIIILQATIFMVGITLMLLGGRANYAVVPARDWHRFVAEPLGEFAAMEDPANSRALSDETAE